MHNEKPNTDESNESDAEQEGLFSDDPESGEGKNKITSSKHGKETGRRGIGGLHREGLSRK